MFGRRDGDFNSRRFWNWFVAEAHGLANGLEALARGEADAEWLIIGLNERIHRYDPSIEADLVRTLDGGCQLTLSGANEASIAALIHSAPRLPGWRFAADQTRADPRRVPFRLAPRPSMDTASPIQARHEAYAA